MALHNIKLKSNSVVFTDAVSLKKKKSIKLSNISIAISIVARSKFTTQVSIYDGAFLRKYLTAYYFSIKTPSQMFDWVIMGLRKY